MHLINVQNEYPMVYLQYDANIPEGQHEMVGYVQPGTLRLEDGRVLPLEAGESELVEGLVPDASVLIKGVAPLPASDEWAQQACTCTAVVAATGVRVCGDCTQRAPVPVGGGCLQGQCPSDLPVEEILEMEQAIYNQLYVMVTIRCSGCQYTTSALYVCYLLVVCATLLCSLYDITV